MLENPGKSWNFDSPESGNPIGSNAFCLRKYDSALKQTRWRVGLPYCYSVTPTTK